eukprot:CAMPEP_0202069042 /NCGR_PEP_ID=MMETSP0964-20121228/218_1 /ASSEMBLY_ACC=CAM_ASM_000500 /TAXON_ID=4773 /ORGANISM="Schizochytrium aggregatum, Strain ATCC28209" /LENGTH=572 /DNA_ID=CAMNT_0048635779 /DNA_START=993 /DNA_END=2715 /DNA_ORIENTATION=-
METIEGLVSCGLRHMLKKLSDIPSKVRVEARQQQLLSCEVRVRVQDVRCEALNDVDLFAGREASDNFRYCSKLNRNCAVRWPSSHLTLAEPGSVTLKRTRISSSCSAESLSIAAGGSGSAGEAIRPRPSRRDEAQRPVREADNRNRGLARAWRPRLLLVLVAGGLWLVAGGLWLVARGSRLCYARLLAHSSAGAADGGAGPSGNAPSRMRRSMDACSSVWEQRRFVSTTSAWTRVQELARCSARAEVSTPSACKAAAARTAQSRPSAASRSALLQSARRTARSKRRRSASSLGGGMAARPAIASMAALHETPSPSSGAAAAAVAALVWARLEHLCTAAARVGERDVACKHLWNTFKPELLSAGTVFQAVAARVLRLTSGCWQAQAMARATHSQAPAVAEERGESNTQGATGSQQQQQQQQKDVMGRVRTTASGTPLRGKDGVSVIAQPLANEKLLKKTLKVVKKASKSKKIRRGVKEVQKALRKQKEGQKKGIVVLAGDISPIDVISHLPVLCEENGIPYVYVPSKAELGSAGSTKRPTSCVMVVPGDDGKWEHQELYDDLESKVLEVAPKY